MKMGCPTVKSQIHSRHAQSFLVQLLHYFRRLGTSTVNTQAIKDNLKCTLFLLSENGDITNDKFLKNSGFTGFLMHPGPMNIDSEITNDVANSKNSLVLRQVENGLYLRAALLSLIL